MNLRLDGHVSNNLCRRKKCPEVALEPLVWNGTQVSLLVDHMTRGSDKISQGLSLFAIQVGMMGDRSTSAMGLFWVVDNYEALTTALDT